MDGSPFLEQSLNARPRFRSSTAICRSAPGVVDPLLEIHRVIHKGLLEIELLNLRDGPQGGRRGACPATDEVNIPLLFKQGLERRVLPA